MNQNLKENIEESLQMLSISQKFDFHGTKQTIKSRDDEVSDLTRIRRFLILGTKNGTYYTSEQNLTIENLEDLVKIIKKGKGGLILREILDISLSGRAPKQEPTMMALALCARFNVKDRGSILKKKRDGKNLTKEEKQQLYVHDYIVELHKAAFSAVRKVARIPTHLFMFVQFCEVVSNAFSIKSQNKGSTGWSRMMRKSIAAWYLEREPKQLVYHITKYRQREGWSHRDLLRLCHPDVSNKGDDALVYDQIFHYVVHGETSPIKRKFPQETTDEPAAKKSRKNYELTQTMLEKETTSEALKLLDAFVSIKHLTQSHHDKRVAQAIREHGLVREHISTELLNSPAVWIALLENMPLTALIRNLAKLSSLKIIREENKGYQYQQQDDLVISKITDEKHLKAARVHPLTILLALSTYRQGHGIQGHLEWKTNSKIVEALEKAFLLSFHNVEPTGKRILLAYDVSASMTETILGTHLSCREAAAALGMCFLKTEPKVECMAFSQKFDKLPFDKDWDLMKMVDYVKCMKFGFTNCALPMIWAADNKKDFDVFIVFTDSETFHGKVKPFEALQQYRKAMNIPDAKLIVVGMTSTKFTIADPTDPGMLDVVGFDSAVPELIRNFVMGQI